MIEHEVQARYLDKVLLDTPALALEAARHEVRRMARRVVSMFEQSLHVVLSGDAEELEGLRSRDDQVDALYRQIVAYLGEVSKRSLDQAQTDHLMQLMSAVNDLKSLGDLVETDLVHLGQRRLAGGVVVSEPTRGVLSGLHRHVHEALVW